MAAELDIPLIIHDREAHGDTVDILRKYGKGCRGVFHCYSGSYEMAKELINMGFYLGFGGTTVFPKSLKLKDIVARLPEDRILIETDCPYLTPPPYRGKRNEPAYVRFVADENCRVEGNGQCTYPKDDVGEREAAFRTFVEGSYEKERCKNYNHRFPRT